MKKVISFVVVIAVVFFMASKVVGNIEWLWGFPTGSTGDMSMNNYSIEAGKDLILEGYSVSAQGQSGTKGCLWIFRGPQTLNWSITNGVPWVVDSSKGQGFFNERLQNMVNNNNARSDIRPLPQWGNNPPNPGNFVEKLLNSGDCTTGYVEMYNPRNGTWTPQTVDTQAVFFINTSFSVVRIRYRTGTSSLFDVFSYYAKPAQPNYKAVLDNYALQLHINCSEIKIAFPVDEKN